jgi:hypothetical protein
MTEQAHQLEEVLRRTCSVSKPRGKLAWMTQRRLSRCPLWEVPVKGKHEHSTGFAILHQNVGCFYISRWFDVLLGIQAFVEPS